jgi:hypothetical protein
MAEILVIFAGLPFLFLVSVAVSPPPLFDKIYLYQKLALLSWLAFVSYCLFPIYLIVNLLVRVVPHSPIVLTVDDVFQLLLFAASMFLGWYLRQLVEDVRKQAETGAIRHDLAELLIRPPSMISKQAPPATKKVHKSKK